MAIPARFRRLWPWVKLALAVGIIAFIGRQLARDLSPDIRERLLARPIDYRLLVVAAVLYLAGLGLSMRYWQRLLARLGYRPGWRAALRAYYIGHMGKYLPGKAWALALRSGLVRAAGVRTSVAVATSFYEVLATMAGGTALAVVLSLLLLPYHPGGWHPGAVVDLILLRHQPPGGLDARVLAAFALALLAAVGIPIIPPVFNRLVHRLSLPFRDPAAGPMPHLGWGAFAEAFLWTVPAWLVLGGSLWAVMRAMTPGPVDLSPALLGRYSAYLATAYVAGFVIFLVPSGLGVREFLLTLFMTQELVAYAGLAADQARGCAALGVIVLRVVWTLAEVAIVSSVYWLRTGPSAPENLPVRAEGFEKTT